MEKQINQADAIKILIKAAHMSQRKGVFNLEEAVIIHKAISVFMVKNENDNQFIESMSKSNSINNSNLTSKP